MSSASRVAVSAASSASFVRHDGKGFAHQLGIHSDDVIVGVVQLTRETRTPPADMVVLCLGARRVTELAAVAVLTGMRGAAAGDAQRPGKVTDAIAEGPQAAWR